MRRSVGAKTTRLNCLRGPDGRLQETRKNFWLLHSLRQHTFGLPWGGGRQPTLFWSRPSKFRLSLIPAFSSYLPFWEPLCVAS